MAQDHLAIERALRLLGERLDYMDAPATVLLIGGGAALSILRLVIRTTRDVDVIALLQAGPDGCEVTLTKPDPFPAHLREAADHVARDLGLSTDWLNPWPTSLLDLGLPTGCLERCVGRDYGSRLRLLILGRHDQIHLKLYAAVDQAGGRHLSDLLELKPTAEELLTAALWARTHDPSPGFHKELAHLLVQIGHGDVAGRL